MAVSVAIRTDVVLVLLSLHDCSWMFLTADATEILEFRHHDAVGVRGRWWISEADLKTRLFLDALTQRSDTVLASSGSCATVVLRLVHLPANHNCSRFDTLPCQVLSQVIDIFLQTNLSAASQK